MESFNFQRTQKSQLLCFLLTVLVFQFSPVFAEIPDSLEHIAPQNRINRSIDTADRITLHGNRNPVQDSGEDQGAVDDKLVLQNIILHLKSSPEQIAALKTFNQAQQTPGAPEYHHWLTPTEFAQRFGVAQQDLELIQNFLTQQGFTVNEISAGGRSIVFSGTAKQVKNTFHTEIHHYLWRGEKHIANSSDPQIPAALSDVVEGVVNLHNFFTHSRKPPHSLNKSAHPGTSLSTGDTNTFDIFPISEFTSGSSHYLTPGDYAVIYDINPLYKASMNGNGVSIAVLGRSDILTTDVTSFQSFSGLPSKIPQIVKPSGSPGLVSGDQTESSLDVEWAAGIAPGATIKFVTIPSTTTADGITLAAQYAVQNNIGDIISLSYGLCETAMGSSGLIFWASLWNQAQTQGQTILVSSGDSGAAGCDTSSNATASNGAYVNGICSNPFNTCVGGTQFIDTANPSQYWLSSNPSGSTTSAIKYIPEAVWNESAAVSGGSGLWSSGGGKSVFWYKPAWQAAPGVPTDGFRDVPDVSMTAAQHDGYFIYMNGKQYIAAGTSAAAPALAGILAMLVQYNGRQGDINTNLYGLYKLQSSGSYTYFHPTLSGNNSVPGQIGYSATGTGYNLATGLGSVDANLLVRHWHDVSNINSRNVHAAIESATAMLMPVNSSVALSSSTPQLTSGQTITFTAKVNGDNPSGSIQFLNNGTALVGAVALSNGSASLTTSSLISAGIDNITAAYSGDSNNLPGVSATLSETVQAVTTVTVSTSLTTITAGQSLTLTATVTGANPTGSVQFYVNGTPLGSPVQLVNGVASLTTNGLNTTGQDNITAIYSGDSLNAGNTSPTTQENVVAANPVAVPALSVTQEWLLALLLLLAILGLQKYPPVKSSH